MYDHRRSELRTVATLGIERVAEFSHEVEAAVGLAGKDLFLGRSSVYRLRFGQGL